jgi:DNA polymerase
MILGEAPGAEEDKVGLPFQGKSGIIIDKVLAKADVSVRITNCVRCRPPENRNPTSSELAACFPHLLKEIEEIMPTVIVTMGRVPLKNLIPSTYKKTLKHWIGRSPLTFLMDGEPVPVYPLYHPAYILRNQSKMTAYIDEFAKLLIKIYKGE